MPHFCGYASANQKITERVMNILIKFLWFANSLEGSNYFPFGLFSSADCLCLVSIYLFKTLIQEEVEMQMTLFLSLTNYVNYCTYKYSLQITKVIKSVALVFKSVWNLNFYLQAKKNGESMKILPSTQLQIYQYG